MLKNITIIGETAVFNKNFAISFLTPKFLPDFLQNLNNEMSARKYYNKEMAVDFLNVKILCYKIIDPIPLFFALVYDDSVVLEKLQPALQKVVHFTLEYIQKHDNQFVILDQPKMAETFDPIINHLLSVRPPKICVIGFNRVGKTSICELISGNEIKSVTPTMVVERKNVSLYGIPLTLWDFSDEVPFSMWKKFMLGSDAIIIVLDSMQANAEKSKKLLSLTNEAVPHAELLIVANKQDADGVLPPEELEKILGKKVLPFSTTDFANARVIQMQTAELLEIIADELDYSDASFVIQRND